MCCPGDAARRQIANGFAQFESVEWAGGGAVGEGYGRVQALGAGEAQDA